MEIAWLVLEYLRVLLSPQVIAGVLTVFIFLLFHEDIKSLLLRIAKIRFPGGAEVSTSQTEQKVKEDLSEHKLITTVAETFPGLPQDLTIQQRQVIEEILKTERATSYLWEYRYLNYFLVHQTQIILDWLIGLNQTTTYSYYDATWLPTIPSANERNAIISALEAHHLIQIKGTVMEITPKGLEYQQWRGPLN